MYIQRGKRSNKNYKKKLILGFNFKINLLVPIKITAGVRLAG
jgi:hypothetical protein